MLVVEVLRKWHFLFWDDVYSIFSVTLRLSIIHIYRLHTQTHIPVWMHTHIQTQIYLPEHVARFWDWWPKLHNMIKSGGFSLLTLQDAVMLPVPWPFSDWYLPWLLRIPPLVHSDANTIEPFPFSSHVMTL